MTFNNTKLTLLIAVALAIIVATVGRLIPHLPNATPLTSIAILSGLYFSKRVAVLLTLSSLLVSDILLASFTQYSMLGHWSMFSTSVFGSWSWFTYSGYLFMCLCVRQPRQHFIIKMAGYTVGATLLYWLWTNLGTWLTGQLYPLSWSGLSSCYLMALPFLRNALAANLVYMIVFSLCLFPLLVRQQKIHVRLR